MSLTKSQVARLVAQGLARETFQHVTLGHFDVTALRALVEVEFTEIMRCSYEAISIAGGVEMGAVAYLTQNREVDQARCAELTCEQLDEPLIFLLCPPGSNGDGETHLLVDGIHRLVQRDRIGCFEFRFRMVPLDRAPRVDLGDDASIAWGDLDLVPGVGLVRRKS